MRRFIDRTIAAVCEEIGRGEGAGEGSCGDLASFVSIQMRGAPSHLRPALRAATVLFGLWGLWRGAPFHRLGPERRRRQMEGWRRSPLGPCRDLMRFYDSLCLVALYSMDGGAPTGHDTRG
jgi:hypothetical protein